MIKIDPMLKSVFREFENTGIKLNLWQTKHCNYRRYGDGTTMDRVIGLSIDSTLDQIVERFDQMFAEVEICNNDEQIGQQNIDLLAYTQTHETAKPSLILRQHLAIDPDPRYRSRMSEEIVKWIGKALVILTEEKEREDYAVA